MRGLADGARPVERVSDARAKCARSKRARRCRPATSAWSSRVSSTCASSASRDGSPAAQGRAADGRLRPHDRRQADARHVGVRGHAPAARRAGIEGLAARHSRQRRRSARRRRSTRDAPTGEARHEQEAAGRRGVRARRAASRRRRRAALEADRRRLARKPRSRALVIDLRGTADGAPDDGIAAARLFVKSGTLATRAGRDDRDASRSTRPPATARSRCRSCCSSRTARPTPPRSSRRRSSGNKRAELVGEPTAGLAAVQQLVRLPGELRPLADVPSAT